MQYTFDTARSGGTSLEKTPLWEVEVEKKKYRKKLNIFRNGIVF